MDFDFVASPKEDWDLPDDLRTPGEAAKALLRQGLRLELNDYGNAQRLKLYHGQDLMHVTGLGWHVWDGRSWVQDDDGKLVGLRADDVARRIRQEAWLIGADGPAGQMVAEARAGRQRRAVLAALRDDGGISPEETTELDALDAVARQAALAEVKLAEARKPHLRFARSSGNAAPGANMCTIATRYLSADKETLNSDHLAVCAANRTLRFVAGEDPAGEFGRWFRLEDHEHRREDRMTRRLAVDWVPGVEAPAFEAFLARILPDPAVRLFMQRWFGYTLLGLTDAQKIVFFYGLGRNGKSTLVEIVAWLLGSYAAAIPIESLIGAHDRRGDAATPDLVSIPGARMVRASEPQEGQRLNEALLKRLTGGEVIKIRKLHGEFIDVEPRFKLTISGNHKPAVRGTDEGIWRRLLLIPFEQQIPLEEVDPALPERLRAEGPGILNWMIAGAQDFLARGLAEPEAVLVATAEFRADSDPLGRFLREVCEVTGEAADLVSARDLVNAFGLWMQDESLSPWPAQRTQKKLRDLADKAVFDGRAFVRTKDSISKYRGIRLPEELALRAAALEEDIGGPARRGGRGRSTGAEDLL